MSNLNRNVAPLTNDNESTKIIKNLSRNKGDYSLTVKYSFEEETQVRNINDDSKDIKGGSNKGLFDGSFDEKLREAADWIYNTVTQAGRDAAEAITGNPDASAEEMFNTVLDIVYTGAGNIVDDAAGDISEAMGNANSFLNDFGNTVRELSGYGLGKTLRGIFSIVADGMQDYKDGVTETSFGSAMEDSWSGTSNAFLDYFSTNYGRVRISSSTPLDPGPDREALYGNLMLGCPFLFNEYSDPNNRALINTFIKDGKFLSLTPGMPKYNGLTSYVGKLENSILSQTDTADEMISYLERNGLDSTFTAKDKRYYTFEAKYDDYFAYLETMLNAIWIKLGLAKNGNQFDLFSFFQIKNGDGINAGGSKQLQPQYNSSIGFYVNAASAVSESVDNQTAGLGSDLSQAANARASEYQRINYITGMGTGSAGQNLARKFAIGSNTVSHIKELVSDTFKNAGEAISELGNIQAQSKVGYAAQLILGGVKTVVGAAMDVANFTTQNDAGAVLQSFATSNGMKVVYPDLWGDSTYSRPINFNFNFVSPYGDPLSIFKYVYVPFCALACFCLPRQAAENGYVSPFLVRADVPGLLTSDLAMITSMSWQRGGDQQLWTKDGLPRAISGSITISDLYPYLSMSKRLSFLSANPSYTVFLDSLTGMCALADITKDDSLNAYFTNMIDRVNGNYTSTGLWNKFNSNKLSEVYRVSNLRRSSVSGKTLHNHGVPWLHNSSI